MKYSFNRISPTHIQIKVVSKDGVVFGAYFPCFVDPQEIHLQEIFKHRFDIFWIEADVVVTVVEPDKMALVKYKNLRA